MRRCYLWSLQHFQARPNGRRQRIRRKMHERNPYNKAIDFESLAKSYPPLQPLWVFFPFGFIAFSAEIKEV